MALSEPPRLLPVSELCHEGRAPAVPFQVRGEDGEIITLERLLRVLPGKRIVGEARWRDRHVLAKLFVARHNSRHWERERLGLESLRVANILTPGVVAAGRLDGGGHYLLTEFFQDSRTLAEQSCGVDALSPESPAVRELLQPAFALLGRLHAAGLIQNDLHLGNFLAYRNELFVIDGDGVVSMGKGAAVAAQQSMENLALLIAQLPLSWEGCLDSLVDAYTSEQERWRPGREVLLQAVERVRARRLSRFLAKTLRDCSQFSVRSTSSRFSVVVRSDKEALSALMEDPDGFMTRGQLLKDGSTCTVARVDIGGRALVVKRYNLKSFRHALSRFWRPSRAWHSWVAGHRLAFYGIPTPAPLAMLEERIGPMRGRAFLVTEFCPGESLLQHLSDDREPDMAEAEALRNLFGVLFRLKISHGDMKANNLLWRDGCLSLIDLDSLTQHGSARAFVRAWRRDRERFLRNWPKKSVLHRWLVTSLPEALIPCSGDAPTTSGSTRR